MIPQITTNTLNAALICALIALGSIGKGISISPLINMAHDKAKKRIRTGEILINRRFEELGLTTEGGLYICNNSR